MFGDDQWVRNLLEDNNVGDKTTTNVEEMTKQRASAKQPLRDLTNSTNTTTKTTDEASSKPRRGAAANDTTKMGVDFGQTTILTEQQEAEKLNQLAAGQQNEATLQEQAATDVAHLDLQQTMDVAPMPALYQETILSNETFGAATAQRSQQIG